MCSSSIDVGVNVDDDDVSIGGSRWCSSISGVCHDVNEKIVDVGVRLFVGVDVDTYAGSHHSSDIVVINIFEVKYR